VNLRKKGERDMERNEGREKASYMCVLQRGLQYK